MNCPVRDKQETEATWPERMANGRCDEDLENWLDEKGLVSSSVSLLVELDASESKNEGESLDFEMWEFIGLFEV